MRAFASCHAKAMRSNWRVALIQHRGFLRLPVNGLRDARTRPSPGSRNRSTESKGPVIFSGIQPTGIPHLGNYLGALRSWVELQNGRRDIYRCLFCVVDLHALTSPQNAEHLARWRKESFASLMAVGLDPKKSIIFIQSDVSLLSSNLNTTNRVRSLPRIRS